MFSWVILTIAILFEVAGSVCLKLSHGFTRLTPSILLFVFYGAAIACASIAIKKIDISVAYTIWAGVGTAIVAVIGIYYFQEPSNLIKVLSIGLIVVGVIGLNVSNTSSTNPFFCKHSTTKCLPFPFMSIIIPILSHDIPEGVGTYFFQHIRTKSIKRAGFLCPPPSARSSQGGFCGNYCLSLLC